MEDNLNKLRAQYDDFSAMGFRLIDCASEQICELLKRNSIALGAPLEARVKSLISLEGKITRKQLEIGNLCDLDDFVGFRIILLFRSDLPSIGNIIKDNFDVVSYEDTAVRLAESQFGYQSDHYVVRIKPDWERIPTYKGLRELKAEIQVRTMAQHIWATASHKLQYKQEENVPKEIIRSIHRVSALLETVDLELDRVNEDRENYASRTSKFMTEEVELNVEIVGKVLAELWPSRNLMPGHEDYDNLSSELKHFGVNTSLQLKRLILENRSSLLKEEEELLKGFEKRPELSQYAANALKNGYYFTQVALTRKALRKRFGEDAVNAVITCGASRYRVHPPSTRKGTSKRKATF